MNWPALWSHRPCVNLTEHPSLIGIFKLTSGKISMCQLPKSLGWTSIHVFNWLTPSDTEFDPGDVNRSSYLSIYSASWIPYRNQSSRSTSSSITTSTTTSFNFHKVSIKAWLRCVIIILIMTTKFSQVRYLVTNTWNSRQTKQKTSKPVLWKWLSQPRKQVSVVSHL